jgi:hypothetical protein
VLLHPEEFTVWKIPALQARNGDDEMPVAREQMPVIRESHGVSALTSDTVRVTLSPVWYASVSPRTTSFVHFDLLYDFESGGRVNRYVAKYEENAGDGSPTYVPRLVESSRLGNLKVESSFTALSIRSGSEDFYLMWCDGTRLTMHLSTRSKTSEDGSTSQTRPVALSVPLMHGARYGQVVTCPVSGRVCSLSLDLKVIHVTDFLGPPRQP